MKILGISILLVTGSLVMASENSNVALDEYYSSLELDGAVAEYNAKGKFDNEGSQEVYRKRSHRRKRIIRPPSRGK
tara:strand:- start:5 stop:232 length:228 start_codon:yes stop_codon:yes gene_type:complete